MENFISVRVLTQGGYDMRQSSLGGVVVIVMCLVGLVGCQTKLRVISDLGNVENRQKDGQPLEGIVYYLPGVKLGINATWTLVDCPSRRNPKVQFTAEITEEYVADRSRQFFIDYESLNAPLKEYRYESVAISKWHLTIYKWRDHKPNQRRGSVIVGSGQVCHHQRDRQASKHVSEFTGK